MLQIYLAIGKPQYPEHKKKVIITSFKAKSINDARMICQNTMDMSREWSIKATGRI